MLRLRLVESCADRFIACYIYLNWLDCAGRRAECGFQHRYDCVRFVQRSTAENDMVG